MMADVNEDLAEHVRILVSAMIASGELDDVFYSRFGVLPASES